MTISSDFSWNWSLYRRWIAANALAELIGLGGSLATVGAIFWLAGGVETPLIVIVMALIAILFGTLFEGVIVGLFQWRVLREVFPAITRRVWVTATAVGAGLAWTLGMIPSTVMSLTAAPPPPGEPALTYEPPALLVYGLAGGMGLLLGAILSAAQWRVLRGHARGAGGWIPANMLAWALGLPLTFVGTTSLPSDAPPTPAILIPMIAVSTLAAGAVVGAVHGIILMRLARRA
jgi:hypothetical protein